jgi:hypothetical protein
VEVNDLNGDGKQDLLVVSNGNNGSVLAYDVQEAWKLVTNDIKRKFKQ